MAKAEAVGSRRVFARKKFTQPLFNQHPEGCGNKADDQTREPQDIHPNVFVGNLERGRRGGRDIRSDEGTVREIDPVAGRLCSDAFDRIDYPIGGLLLKIGIYSYEEGGKDRGEETCLQSGLHP